MKFYKPIDIPTFLYASKACTRGKEEEKKIETVEMKNEMNEEDKNSLHKKIKVRTFNKSYTLF